MKYTFFYSWQNDLPGKQHRYFLEKVINVAIKKLKDKDIVFDLEKDTRGNVGSPDIIDTILQKINNCSIFVCDLSAEHVPNANVLFELGYAVNRLGWDRIICLFDREIISPEEMPFDIKKNRLTAFSPTDSGEIKRLSKILENNAVSLVKDGKINDPFLEEEKSYIDKIILDVLYSFSEIFYGTKSLKEISKLLECSTLPEVEQSFPSYLALNDYSSNLELAREKLKEFSVNSLFPFEWRNTIISLIKWIRSYQLFVSEIPRTNPFPFLIENEIPGIKVVSGKEINPNNPALSKLVLQKLDNDKYKVITSTEYAARELVLLSKNIKIKSAMKDEFCDYVKGIKAIANHWLLITGGEFLLSQDFYVLGRKNH